MQQLDLLRLSLSLVLVIVLIFAAAWLARRSGLLRNRGQATIEIIASQSLGGRNSIVVVEVEKKRMVLGITQHQINLLQTLPEDAAFASTLQQALLPKTSSTETTEASENNAS